MNRPSHWILASLLATGVTLWATGAAGEWLEGHPADVTAKVADSDAGTPNPDPERRVLRRPEGRAPTPVEFTVHEIAGRVVDRGGWPVEAARVYRRPHDHGRWQNAWRGDSAGEVVETDARGRFRLEWSGPLVGTVCVEAEGRHAPAYVRPSLDGLQIVLQDPLPDAWLAAEAASVAADAPEVRESLLVGEGFLKGPEGIEIPGARIQTREFGALAVSDETGRYLLPIAPGPMSLIAWDTAGHVATAEAPDPGRNQGMVPLPELVLRPGLELRGRVVDGDGQPVVDASVSIENSGSLRSARTDETGHFTVAGLAPVETAVTVSPHRGHLGLRRVAMVEHDLDIGDIRLERPRQEPLRLTVVDSARRPMPWVHVVADQEEGLCRAYARASQQGEVVLAGLGSGPVAFEVRDPEMEPVHVEDFDLDSRMLVVSR